MTYIQYSLNNGRISRWDKHDFPLPIFIEKCRWYAAKGEESKYNDMVIRAIKDWEVRTNGLIRFKVIDRLYDSKVNLTWKRVDRKSLGLCTFNFEKSRMFSAEVEIGLSDGIIHQKYMDDNEVYHTILHELGHAVGLGHSPERQDIMYTPHQYGMVNISDNDVQTLLYIYNLPIGLTGKQMGEHFQIDSKNFDEIIAILEQRVEENENYKPEKPPMQVQDQSRGRNLSEENDRIADLKKYDMVLNKIKVDVTPLIHKNIYKNNPKRH